MDQEKLDYIIQVGRAIRNARSAIDVAVKYKLGGTFSNAYGALSEWDISLNWEDAIKENPHLEYPAFDMLEPGYQFSDNPGIFSVEFAAAYLFFASTKEEDPRIDFLAMRVLFHAGRILERLKYKGRIYSDIPTKAGSTKHKGYVSDQDVIQAAKEVSKRLKSKRDIARVVRKRLLKDESEKENPKKVYKEDHIRKKILKEAWSEIL